MVEALWNHCQNTEWEAQAKGEAFLGVNPLVEPKIHHSSVLHTSLYQERVYNDSLDLLVLGLSAIEEGDSFVCHFLATPRIVHRNEVRLDLVQIRLVWDLCARV